MSLIPGLSSLDSVLQPTGISLEREGLKMFGDYVDDKNRLQAFKDLGLSDADAQALLTQAKLGEFDVRGGSIAHNLIPPKQKFLFEVEFKIHEQIYKELVGMFENSYNCKAGSEVLSSFGYFVKQVDRPKVEYTYEDVNMYNFRTRVLTRVAHMPLNLWFWDDSRNTVGEFFNLYRQMHSPMASQEAMYGLANQSGFNFNGTGRNYGSRIALPGNAPMFLSEVAIRQIYSTHHAAASAQSAFSMTEYRFLNPTIRRFDFDDVNHENGESNGVQVEFDYEGLYIEDYYVKEIKKHDSLKDMYIFVKGNKITDNLSTFNISADKANKIKGINDLKNLNLLDEAKRAVMSGNPLSYVKERGMGVMRDQISSGVSGAPSSTGIIGGLFRSNPAPKNPDDTSFI